MVDFSIVMLVFGMYPTIFVDQNTTRYRWQMLPTVKFLPVFMGLLKVNLDAKLFPRASMEKFMCEMPRNRRICLEQIGWNMFFLPQNCGSWLVASFLASWQIWTNDLFWAISKDSRNISYKTITVVCGKYRGSRVIWLQVNWKNSPIWIAGIFLGGFLPNSCLPLSSSKVLFQKHRLQRATLRGSKSTS